MIFNFREFLQYLIFGGGSVAAMSFIAERWKWFQSLEAEQKKFYSFVGSALIGSSALAFITYASDALIAGLTPYFAVVSISFASYYIGQIFHAIDKKPTSTNTVSIESPKEVTINESENVTLN